MSQETPPSDPGSIAPANADAPAEAGGNGAGNQVRPLWLQGPAGLLEARLRVAADPIAAAVVAHPHPQHGGTLDNPVIFHSDRELHRAGLTTLRFNFRGVGRSEGTYDNGVGEVDDVAAAVSWLRGLTVGRPLILVGFSFGSLCSIRYALRDASIHALIAIGFPVNRYELPEVISLGRPLSIVQASDDEFGRPDEVWTAVSEAQPTPRLIVVDGTTHLFPRRAADAGRAVRQAAEELLR